jgi:outer membrane protein assembly factor BamB
MTRGRHPQRQSPAPSARRLGGALLAALLALGTLPAQRGAAPDAFARGRLFSLPRSQDDIFAWRQAQEDIAAGRFADAVERLHYLLQFGQRGVVPVNDAGDLFLGLRAAVIATLCNLPAEGAAAYEKLTQREAGRLLHSAFAGVQPAELESLASGFPTSSAGVRARVRLADLALEEGRAYEAQMHCRAALDCVRDDDPQRAAIARRMAAAQMLLGAAPDGDRTTEALAAELRSALPLGRTVPADAFGSYGRGLDAAGHMAAPQGNLRLQYRITDVRARGFNFSDRPFPMHAVGDRDGIIINDGLSLDCFDPLSGAELWRAPGPLVDEPEMDFDDPETAINRDMVLAAACTADVVVGALQVPQIGQTERFKHIDVIHRIPRRRLFAVDRASGKRIWSHWDRIDGPVTTAFEGHDAAGPPLILGDTVYVASHDQTGAIAYYLTAYDLATGAPRWRSLVCSSQGEVNMFGNSRQEYAASPLVEHGGVIFGTTNMGVCFAADAATGHLRWVTPYDVIPLPETRLTDQRPREVYFANNALMICDGVVASTPLDSDSALGFDIETGVHLWSLPYRQPQRPQEICWLLGALDGEFIFAGTGILAMPARPAGPKPKPRVVRSTESLRRASDDFPVILTPRGAVADGAIFFSSASGLRVIAPTGDERDSRLVATEIPLGNLLLVDGILVSVRGDSVDFFFDRERLMQVAEERVRAHPDDPAALLELASLLRGATGSFSESRTERAEATYRRGLELARRAGLGMQSPVYRRLANDLFRMRFENAARVQGRNQAEALKILRTARDDAPLPEQWLEAERAVLELVRGDRQAYLAELELMAQRNGDAVTRFPGVGRVPVAAYALWQSALGDTDPARAAQSSQELLERFGDVRLGDRAARDIAREIQLRIIGEHGAAAYAEIEARARAALQAAAGEPELLRQVITRYPPSEAAKDAVASMLDLAVERGDLAAAARSYAQALLRERGGPGLDRRLMVAAQKGGNPALATALARRLLATGADQPSDFPPDGGKLLRDVAAPPEVPAAAPEPPSERPEAILMTKARANGAATAPRLREALLASGFPPPPRPLVFLAVDGERLEAIDPTLGAEMLTAPVLSDIPFADGEGEQILVCGSVLVLCEPTRVRAIDATTGAEKWSVAAEPGRRLQSLGTQDGVLHLFSDLESASDGGYLLGIEPITGATLFQFAFPADAPSICPTSSGGALWEFQPGRGDAEPVIVRHDPLSGQPDLRISLGSSLLQRLGLGDDDRRAFRVSMLQRNLFADDHTVYLPVVAPDRSSARGVAALDFKGRERWLWRAMQDREVVMAALHGDRVVVLEQGGNGGRLVLLDKASGSVRREVVCGTDASVNWSRGYRSADAPDVLILVDRSVPTTSAASRGQLNITCFSLDSSVGSFAHDLRGTYEQIVDRPVLGRGFIAFGAMQEDELTLFALDVETRRSILPEGRSRMRLPLLPPFQMQAVGPYVAVQSSEGITILGPKAPPR